MKTIISLGDYKQAALYFENVIPFSFYLQEMPKIYKLKEQDMIEHVRSIKIDSIIPLELQNDDFMERLEGMNILMFKSMLAFSDDPKVSELLHEMEWTRQEILDELSETGPSFMSRYKLNGLPYDVLETSNQQLKSRESVLISIPNMSFINTDDLSWEKVLEFRNDKDSLAKLRLFRTFVFDNYRDKPKSYIEDDILRRVDDYNDTIKKWKFNTFHGCLQSALTSKNMAGAMSGSFLSVLMNAPLTAVLSGVAGASIEVGKTVLEISKCKVNLRETLDQNPVSYIAEVNNSLAK